MNGDMQSMTGVAQAILDFDELLALIKHGLPRTTPWQRSLAARLDELDQKMQILRMTISMGRHDDEIRDAATTLCCVFQPIVDAISG